MNTLPSNPALWPHCFRYAETAHKHLLDFGEKWKQYDKEKLRLILRIPPMMGGEEFGYAAALGALFQHPEWRVLLTTSGRHKNLFLGDANLKENARLRSLERIQPAPDEEEIRESESAWRVHGEAGRLVTSPLYFSRFGNPFDITIVTGIFSAWSHCLSHQNQYNAYACVSALAWLSPGPMLVIENARANASFFDGDCLDRLIERHGFTLVNLPAVSPEGKPLMASWSEEDVANARNYAGALRWASEYLGVLGKQAMAGRPEDRPSALEHLERPPKGVPQE